MQTPHSDLQHTTVSNQAGANSDVIADVRTASESDSPEVLNDIYQDLHNIVIWRRSLPSNLLSAVNDLLKSNRLFEITMKVKPQSVFVVMSEALQDFDCEKVIIEDIAELVDKFCSLFKLQQVNLNLRAINNTMCPRFHVDTMPCRLVTTYLGSGTQWLPNYAVDRTKLEAGNNGLPDYLSGIYKSSEDIQQLNNGDVALLKGKLWKGNEYNGLVHRSPDLAPGEKRLLLSLDFIQ